MPRFILRLLKSHPFCSSSCAGSGALVPLNPVALSKAPRRTATGGRQTRRTRSQGVSAAAGQACAHGPPEHGRADSGSRGVGAGSGGREESVGRGGDAGRERGGVAAQVGDEKREERG
ncbi:unnamed protein product [Urochloa humidicola]